MMKAGFWVRSALLSSSGERIRAMLECGQRVGTVFGAEKSVSSDLDSTAQARGPRGLFEGSGSYFGLRILLLRGSLLWY